MATRITFFSFQHGTTFKLAVMVLLSLLLPHNPAQGTISRPAQSGDLAEANRLNQEVQRLYDEGRYDEAIPLAARVLSTREKALGREHPDVAQSLNNLGGLYHAKGDFAKAEPLLRRALAIREEALRPDHPDVAASVNNLALLYFEKGVYAKAEPLLQRALAMLETAVGPDDPSVATLLNNLAGVYSEKGDYQKAELSYQRALAIYEKAFGLDHFYVGASLSNLAELYKLKGDYAKAESFFQRALAALEKVLGPDHPDLASSLSNLAGMYGKKGDYASAETLYQRALTIRERALGPDHPDVAGVLSGLAAVYELKGDYAKAEPLLRRALAAEEKALGPDNSKLATSLNNLAVSYFEKGEYAKAEPLFQRALCIREKALGPDHPSVGASFSDLAALYNAKGDYEKAEPLYQRALSIREKALGPDHPDVATSLNNLAVSYVEKGEYEKAEPLYQRALVISEKTLGPDNPYLAMSLDNLAVLYSAKGNYAKAIEFLSRACEIGERNIVLNTDTGSERQKLLYLYKFSRQTDWAISLHALLAPNNPAALRLAVTTLLRRKGRSLDAMTDIIGPLRRRLGPQDRTLLDQFSNLRSRLATLALRGPDRLRPAQHIVEVTQLENQMEDLETKISALSAEFRAQNQKATIAAIQEVIPDDAALVEFLSFHPVDPKTSEYGPLRYVAYVLTSRGEPSWKLLGNTSDIDALVARLRSALRTRNRSDVKEIAREVDEAVMRPVRKLLGSTRRVLLSPDGALNLIPFAALVDERNRYLVEEYSFTYLTSGRDLLRLKTRLQTKQGEMVIADPDFNASANNPSKAPTGPNLGWMKFEPLKPLKASAHEAIELKAILPGATVLTQGKATEAALKQISSPTLLHIATHGFFLEDEDDKPPAITRARQTRIIIRRRNQPGDLTEEPMPEAKIANPLLRSGLFLAGANAARIGDESDGILTALEAAGLDLWGTRLVVLSACDTGVGEVKDGEGVYGLRRALVLAGSESQVMSLWPVSDTGASELMIGYYKALRSGQGRSEALRHVQLRMLGDPTRQHPFYWASFIQSGEWANLDGKRIN